VLLDRKLHLGMERSKRLWQPDDAPRLPPGERAEASNPPRMARRLSGSQHQAAVLRTGVHALVTPTTTLEETVALFRRAPSAVPNLHEAAQRKYAAFCQGRTAELYTTFLALVGNQDTGWCSEAVYAPAFRASAPFPGKKNERTVSGGMAAGSKRMHGLVRYEYHQCAIEECRRDGLEHGLRVTCTQMGDVWVRLHKRGKRLAQVVLNADLSEQSPMAVDGGGLKLLRQHLHLIRDCFAPT